jgi:hypothetical protein
VGLFATQEVPKDSYDRLIVFNQELVLLTVLDPVISVEVSQVEAFELLEVKVVWEA